MRVRLIFCLKKTDQKNLEFLARARFERRNVSLTIAWRRIRPLPRFSSVTPLSRHTLYLTLSCTWHVKFKMRALCVLWLVVLLVHVIAGRMCVLLL